MKKVVDMQAYKHKQDTKKDMKDMKELTVAKQMTSWLAEHAKSWGAEE